jgi:hypothetical protein
MRTGRVYIYLFSAVKDQVRPPTALSVNGKDLTLLSEHGTKSG